MSITKDFAIRRELHCIGFDAENKHNFEAHVDSDGELYLEINLLDSCALVKNMTIPKGVAIKLRDFLNYAYPQSKEYE